MYTESNMFSFRSTLFNTIEAWSLTVNEHDNNTLTWRFKQIQCNAIIGDSTIILSLIPHAPVSLIRYLFLQQIQILHKSKRHDLIDMFNDTSRYLDDIFTIDNPEFEKYIPDIYPAKLQLNKANP